MAPFGVSSLDWAGPTPAGFTLPSRLGVLPAVRGGCLTHIKQSILKADLLAGFVGYRLIKYRQLSTTDILAPVTMKNAAKCDT